MKRDMELIRKMVLAVEDAPGGYAPYPMLIEGYTGDRIGYHAYLLINDGLADGADITCSTNTGPSYRIIRLTAAGHDFAESVRAPFIWNEIMTDIREKGLTAASVKVLKQLADNKLRKHLKAD